MRIGLCAWSFTGAHREAGRPDLHSPSGLLALAAQHGLAGIEGASGWFEALSDADRGKLRERLAETGLDLYIDTGSAGYATDISPLTTAVATAGHLGARVVRTTVSGLLEGDRRAFGRDGWSDYLQALVAPLGQAARAAEAAGVDIGIENHQDLCSSELAWLCEQVGSERLGVTMDVGNAYAVGETTLDFARRVQPFLKHVHLKDYRVYPTESGYRLSRCALGAGIVDWPAMLGWLEAEAPQAHACIELGATKARHIRLFEPSWWETYPERAFVPDSIAALGDLHRAARPVEEDGRTPHERDEPAAACAAYELEQFEESVRYLRSLPTP